MPNKLTEREIFFLAIETDRDQRDQFIVEHCGNDNDLLAQVRKLLIEYDRETNFLIDKPFFESEENDNHHVRVIEQGQTMGVFVFERLLGEGGMGEVWAAKQNEPIRRRVAIKLIRPGMETPGVIQRFNVERQALAAMNHPSIARVFDAGTTTDRRPYFVMELINGASLTKFCDESRMSIRKRLALFLQIVRGVEHAHQKAVIHRDLKPSNVLVTMIDGEPVPKIIDFGLAKALSGGLDDGKDRDTVTSFGAVMGTLQYMAPEQAGFSGQSVDTRTDVYSLGVILYELLTGLQPFASEELSDASVEEKLKMVKEVEPPLPSTRLSSSASAISFASLRKTEPIQLSRLLKNELDWVVMKAIQKDRRERYQSARELADDISRYLAGEPVSAHPPSQAYRVRKFIRKNKGLVSSLAVIASVLLMGIAGTSYGLIKANRNSRLMAKEAKRASAAEKMANQEKQDALKARKDAIAAAEKEKRQREFSEAVTDFVKNDILALTTAQGQYRFPQANQEPEFPSEPGKDATLKQLLDRAGNKLLTRDDLEPLAHAELFFIVGVSYRHLGEYELAVDFLQQSVKIRESKLGIQDSMTLNSYNSLGVALRLAEKTELALSHLEYALESAEKSLGESNPLTLRIMSNFASQLSQNDEFEKSQLLHEKVLDLFESSFDENDPAIIEFLVSYADSLCKVRRWDEGCKLYERAIRIHQLNETDDDDLRMLAQMNSLGKHYIDSKNYEDAIRVLSRCYDARTKFLGENDPRTMTTCSYLADAYSKAQQNKKAAPLLEKLLKVSLELYGKSDQSDKTINRLVKASFKNGNFIRALDLSLEVVGNRKRKFGNDHPTTLAVMQNTVLIRSKLGQFDQAIEGAAEVSKLKENKYGADHFETLKSLASFGDVYVQAGRYDSAITIFQSLVEKMEKKLGAQHQDTLDSRRVLADTYRRAGDHGRAIEIYKTIAEIYSDKFGESHPATINSLIGVANAFLRSGKTGEATQLYQKILRAIEASGGERHRYYIVAVANYAQALVRGQEFAKAIPLFEQAFDAAVKRLGKAHPQTITILADIARVNFEAGNSAKSLEVFEAAIASAKAELGDDHDVTLKIAKHQNETIAKVEAAKKRTNPD